MQPCQVVLSCRHCPSASQGNLRGPRRSANAAVAGVEGGGGGGGGGGAADEAPSKEEEELLRIRQQNDWLIVEHSGNRSGRHRGTNILKHE